MSIEKIPAGSRGGSMGPKFMLKLMTPLLVRIHRRSGDKAGGMDVLYLTTTGARSGKTRTAPVARIEDEPGQWLVCASAGGQQEHPAWYHNVVAHPEQVWIEYKGAKHKVDVEQLRGAEREQAWSKITARVPRFKSYLEKTDREMPVLRLTETP